MQHLPIAPWQTATSQGIDVVLLTRGAAPGQVYVRCLPDNEEHLIAMQPDGEIGGWQRWRAIAPWDNGNSLTLYCFVIAAESGHRWLAADGEHALVPPEALHFRVHPSATPPAWVREQVFYQVFPDRFCKAGEHASWQTLSPWGSKVDFHTFCGGNLNGLRAQLPYLQNELGITAIYTTPVFAARSNHRYDTTDFTQVDPLLGGNAALAALRQATQGRGVRLVLDGVFNHTGVAHPWLAQQGANFYAFDGTGQPVGWKGHASLPVLDFALPAVRQAIYGAPDSVLRRWLQPPYSIDGWRFDVIHMLGEGTGALNNLQHVQAMRNAMREENLEAFVLGEHFAEATRWLQGGPEDGAMNYYGFLHPVQGWLAGLSVGSTCARLSTAQFEHALTRAVAAIPYANQLAQLNLLGSHDTPRFLTLLQGNVALMQLAFTLLFTRPGVPCIYYGDEMGLEGGADPDNRRCFDWDRNHWNHALWEHVRTLARLRRERSEWRDGATLTMAQGDDWLVYARCNAQATTLVALNRGPAVTVQVPLHRLPLQATGWRNGDAHTLALPAHSARLVFSI
jgi:alpha-glucosidase